MLIIPSCAAFSGRFVRFCMDKFRTPACALDSADDLRIAHCNSQCKFQPHGDINMGYLSDSTQYAIYMATIDYMVAAYGPYAASATGGNALARDFLAGIAAMYSTPSKPPSFLPSGLLWK